MKTETVYKIAFVNRGDVYELFVKEIFQSDLAGFLEIEDFVFGSRSQIVVDPSEEKLKTEFAGVKRVYIPKQYVLRIDEVEEVGQAKISSVSGTNVAQFPSIGPKGRT